MPTTKTDFTAVLTNIVTCIEKMGAKKTSEILMDAANDGDAYFLRNIIINQTCKKLNISPKNAFKQSKQHGERTDALRIISFLLVKHCKYSYETIKTIINKKSKTNISQYIKFIEELNPNIKQDKDLLAVIAEVENAIENYKLNNK